MGPWYKRIILSLQQCVQITTYTYMYLALKSSHGNYNIYCGECSDFEESLLSLPFVTPPARAAAGV